MSTLALPRSSKPAVFVAIAAFGVALCLTAAHDGRSLWLALIAFFLSGFVGDMFTGFAHFGFDYVFPEKMPILGPIAKEFREHHDGPTLDPRDYVVNFTKGGFASLPLSLITCALSVGMRQDSVSFLIVATFLGLSLWAFFFHQIHSYAHMGSRLPPEEFTRRVTEISHLPNEEEQVREFEKLFETVPIPPIIRLMQRCRLILNPAVHNLHHISFETDFSSVNGWSDPVSNLVLRPIAQRLKAKAESVHA